MKGTMRKTEKGTNRRRSWVVRFNYSEVSFDALAKTAAIPVFFHVE